jgi:hypothetical protein
MKEIEKYLTFGLYKQMLGQILLRYQALYIKYVTAHM